MRAQFEHIGLTVPDLDQAIAWYAQAFEMSVLFSFELEQFGFRAAVMDCPAGWRIELIERTGSRSGLQPTSPIDAAAIQGFGHLCLDVENVDAGFERLRSIGAAERMSPRASPEPGIRMAYVSDPWGNLLELIDRTAAATRPPAEGTIDEHVPVEPEPMTRRQ